MLEITKHETRRQVVGTGAVTVGLAGLTLLILAVGLDASTLVHTVPGWLWDRIGATHERGAFFGVLLTVLYRIGWVLVLGLYFAYSASSMIAAKREAGSFDLLLSAPVSRSSIVRQRFFSLLPPIIAVNVIVAGCVIAEIQLTDQSIAIENIIAIHALSIPYLLLCVSIGLLLSVIVRGSRSAWGSMGIVLVLSQMESIAVATGIPAFIVLSPLEYYDPGVILIASPPELTSAGQLTNGGILLGISLVLLLVSMLAFRRQDL